MQALRRSVRTHQGFGSIGSSLSTGFQVYLSKCWDPYVNPGCTIRLVFFCGLSSLFQYVDLVTTSLRSGFQVYHSQPRQYNTICCGLNLISGFFTFFWLIVWADGIKSVAGVFQEAGAADSRAHTRSQVYVEYIFILYTFTFITWPHLYQEFHVHCIVVTNDGGMGQVESG